jgi:hypothetical protein
MRQAKPAADQAAAGKYLLHLFGRGAGGDVEVLGRFAQQQIAHAAAHDKGLKAGFLQVANYFARVRAKLLEPDSVFGLRDGDEVFNGDLRFVTGCMERSR